MVTYRNTITGRVVHLSEPMRALDRSTKWQRVEQPADDAPKRQRKRRKDDE